MPVMNPRNPEIIRGAAKIEDAIRTQLAQRGRRHEEISIEWHSDSQLPFWSGTPQLRATLAECGSVHQVFSHSELSASRDHVVAESVVAKIRLVVATLSSGLP